MGRARTKERSWWRDRHAPEWTRRTALKVPEVTALFWVVKIVSTAMGEATSDWGVHASPLLVVPVAGLAFVGALALQMRAPRYIPWVYWLAVAMIAVFGTIVADVIHVIFMVPYVVSVLGFSVALALVFRTWYRTEGSLSIHTIHTPRRELFYWATVLTTFALGTAVGDTTAYSLSLGFLTSGIAFAALFAVPFLARRLTGADEVLTFWFAYIVTRPLGASFADWGGTPHDVGGLNLGRGNVSLVLTIVLLVLVGVVARRSRPVGAHG